MEELSFVGLVWCLWAAQMPSEPEEKALDNNPLLVKERPLGTGPPPMDMGQEGHTYLCYHHLQQRPFTSLRADLCNGCDVDLQQSDPQHVPLVYCPLPNSKRGVRNREWGYKMLAPTGWSNPQEMYLGGGS